MSTQDRDPLIKWFALHGLGDQGLNILKQFASNPVIKDHLISFKENFLKNYRAIFFEGYPTHFLCITVDETRLHCDISVVAYTEDVPRLRTQIEGVASSIGLKLNESSEECLEGISRRNLLREPLIHEHLIEGTPPVIAKPASVKLHVKPFSDNPEYNENSDGSVDYHNLNLFENVIENQHIADYIPPIPGSPGRDVFGQQIVSHNDKKVHIVCGAGVAFDEMQGQYFSIKPGYVTFEDQRITVESTYVVEKNVDMGVGNINFVSDVLIRGDVPPDFSVQAGGSIEINGSVTGANLVADKNILLKLGLLGQGKSMVRAGGNFTAKFINESSLEVDGNVEILSEALNSKIGSMKKIIAKDAVVIGGQLVSIDEMHLGTIGSDLGLRTDIFLGEDFSSIKRTEEVRQSIIEMEDKVDGRLEGAAADIKFWQTDHLKENLKTEKLEELLIKLEEFRSMLNDLTLAHQEYELLSQNTPKDRQAVCTVHKRIYAGTVFYCSGDVLRIRENVNGPIVVRAEPSGPKGRYRISIGTEAS